MITSKVVRHIFIPAAALIAEKSKAGSGDRVCRPSELPIYTPDAFKTEKRVTSEPETPGAIEEAFGSMRRNLFAVLAEVKSWQVVAEDYLHEGLQNAEGLIDYLQEEENTVPKYGAIAVGGLTGLIFALRGGFFKKTLYTSVGALGMAAICYPKEASEYSKIGIEEGKRYSAIAYNFIYGVKKDDPPLELPSLPKLPGSFSEAWDAAKNLGKSTSTKSPVSDEEKPKQVQVEEKSNKK